MILWSISGDAIGAVGSAGQQVFTLVRRLREELGVNTTCGASNISFGLPNRHGINNAFLPMAYAAGMTSAIMNPVPCPSARRLLPKRRPPWKRPASFCHRTWTMKPSSNCLAWPTKPRSGKEMEAIRAANFLLNHDEGGAQWIMSNRDPDAALAGASGRREGRRSRG